MAAYLETIVAAHRTAAADDGRSLDAALAVARDLPVARPFRASLVAAAGRDGIAVIAEIKRRSPSAGDLDRDLDPVALSREYEQGGAACLSVLTDADFFGGSPQDLRAARDSCTLPVLRKDFTVSALDVCDARLMGADAVLLIVAALSDSELTSFLQVAADCGLDALVEVHDAAELERALSAGASLIGVNQRDLTTFEVDRRRAADLGATMPPDVVSVAESGIRDADDVRRLADAGYQAVLVGETLVRSPDRRAAVADLVGADP
jgi:indole-3-glycerol phosphate synthase